MTDTDIVERLDDEAWAIINELRGAWCDAPCNYRGGCGCADAIAARILSLRTSLEEARKAFEIEQAMSSSSWRSAALQYVVERDEAVAKLEQAIRERDEARALNEDRKSSDPNGENFTPLMKGVELKQRMIDDLLSQAQKRIAEIASLRDALKPKEQTDDLIATCEKSARSKAIEDCKNVVRRCRDDWAGGKPTPVCDQILAEIDRALNGGGE